MIEMAIIVDGNKVRCAVCAIESIKTGSQINPNPSAILAIMYHNKLLDTLGS